MNYIGSKLSIIDFIKNSINRVLVLSNDKRESKNMVFADLFAGTGIVGASFKKDGYQIVSNDIQYYSYILNKHVIENNQFPKFENILLILKNIKKVPIKKRGYFILKYLETIEGVDGFIFNNYCLGGTKDTENPRVYFSDENGRKADAIRYKIEEWYKNSLINSNEYYFLLASLIDSIDRYANTASVYGAFLKDLKKTAQKTLELKSYQLIIESKQNNKVYNKDVNELIKEISGDILYLDPPYNHRQYAANYHLLETIAKYDNPNIKGKTGLRDYENQKSLYCSKSKAIEALEDLIKYANFKYIFLSYNDEGIVSIEDIEKIFSNQGVYKRFEMEYKRFKADKDENRNHTKESTIEYLHCLVKN